MKKARDLRQFQLTRVCITICLPFGISPAPAVFQRILEQILQGLENVVSRMVDILITGINDRDHMKNLDETLRRLQAAGLQANLNKSKFLMEEVIYLGYIINKNGVHVCQEKIKPILECPTPTSVAELRSFLGMMNYYGQFLPNLSTIQAPLSNLLKKEKNGCGQKRKKEVSNR